MTGRSAVIQSNLCFCHPPFSYLMQRGAHDRYEEAVVEVVQELGADQGMSNLHHGVAELQRVHEQNE